MQTLEQLRKRARKRGLSIRKRAELPALVPQVYEHEQFGKIRVIGDAENPRFCLSDACKMLGIGNPSDVKKRLDKGVVSIETLQTAGGMQKITFVNEDGLYDLILESRKPEARKMRKWITAEVVPSIRKHGVYMTVEAAEKILFNLLAEMKLGELAQKN